MSINWEEQLGSKTDRSTQGSRWGNKASKPHTGKTCGGCSSGGHSQPHRKVRWRDPQGPRTYTNPPTWESAPEGPSLLVGSGGSE